MDTGKLLQIIEDTREEEAAASTQSVLNNIITYYSQNTASALASIDEEKQKLRVYLTEQSPISKYAVSDYSALEKLGVAEYFGPGLYQRLEDILRAPTYEVAGLLQNLGTEREAAISNLQSVQAGLTHFNLKSRVLDDSNYEIGFTLPDSYSDLAKAEKALKDLRLILESVADATDSQQPLRIKYVSNGTIEYFIHAGVQLAQHFDILLDYAIKIYTVLKMYEDGKKLHDNMQAARKKKMNDLVEEQKKDDTNKLLEDMVIELKIPTDKKTEVVGRFRAFLKHIESGVGAEVRTPKINEPKDPGDSATKEQRTAYNQALTNFEKKLDIDQRNREIFILQQNNFYGMDTMFLHEPSTSDSNESV